MNKSYPLILFLAGVCCLSLSVQATAQGGTTITFGLHQNEPLNFQDPTGQPKGLVIDVFGFIAEQEGWQVEYIPCVWKDCLAKLESGEIDLLSAIGYTPDRSEIYDFTDTPLITNWGMLVTPPDTDIESILDLEGKRIAAMKHAGHTLALQDILTNFRITAEYLEVDDFLEVFQRVHDGKAHAGVVNRLQAAQFSSRYGLMKSSIIFNPIEIRYAATKNRHRTILKAIDQHLQAMRKSPESIYYTSLAHWFEDTKPFRLPDWLKFLLLSGAAVILFFLTASFLLRHQVKLKTADLSEKNRALEAESNERRVAEDRLKKSEERYSLAQKAANVGTWDWNIINDTLVWSEQIEPMFGFARGQFHATYKAFLDCIHPDDRRMVVDAVNAALYQGKEYDIEHRIVWPDKSVHWVAEKGTVFRNELGEPVRMLGVVLDVTEQKESFERLRTILDSFDGLIYVADMDTYEMLFINRYGQERWGDITGRTCWQFLQSGQSGPCSFCTNDRLVDSQSNPTGPYVWEIQNTVTNEWFECRDQAIRWLDGRMVRLEIASNITQRKQNEEHKERLEENLRQAQKMEAIGTLAGGIAHDFNNILSIIINASEMSLRELPEKSTPALYNTMALQASLRAKELVRQILAFSRQSAQELVSLDPGQLIRENMNLVRSTTPSTIEIREEIEPIRSSIRADPTQIHQLVINLCTNAIHAMDDKGILTIGLNEVELTREDLFDKPDQQPGRYVHFSVRDTGCGMSGETLERIFDPFFTTKQAGEGTGMGLAVIHGIVKVHGGMITVESQPDQGSAFHVYFPAVEAVQVQERSIANEQLRGHERILLVDDEKMVVEMCDRMLKELGYRVTVKFGGKEALELFRTAPDSFDLVITDQTMPIMTGSELAIELLRIRPDIPIILCTGFSKKISEAKAKQIGIREFILKPFNVSQIAGAIRRVLDAGGKN